MNTTKVTLKPPLFIITLALLIIGAFIWKSLPDITSPVLPEPSNPPVTPAQTVLLPTRQPKTPSLIEPVAQFKQRVTKKPFGIYVTPQNSPVQPERFTGYHTGADTEYADIAGPVPVYSVAAGRILTAQWVSGYGGLVAEQITINNQPIIAIYGHLNPSSLPSVGQQISADEQVGLLGTDYTNQTDGERKHLHFSLVKDTAVNLKGYVQNKSALSDWIDPMSLNYTSP
ncbi:MAG: M23 family metallopeptidase [Candidatus Andersenbacteria bacterium]|nr:M23 family metallopeptidase [bacterium]MDZ4225444.1 M23 family metallopeptidase [Candidatus Andersenbacteria bacterium]